MSNEILDLVKARVKTSDPKIFVTQTPDGIDAGEFSKLYAGVDVSCEPSSVWVMMIRDLVLPYEILCGIDGSNVEAAQSHKRKFVESKVI